MKFKLEVDMSDAAFAHDPQSTLANMLMQVGMWVRDVPMDAPGLYSHLYGNGGEAAPPIGKAEFVRDVPPFKKR
jgi:hypothetical protein